MPHYTITTTKAYVIENTRVREILAQAYPIIPPHAVMGKTADGDVVLTWSGPDDTDHAVTFAYNEFKGLLRTSGFELELDYQLGPTLLSTITRDSKVEKLA